MVPANCDLTEKSHQESKNLDGFLVRNQKSEYAKCEKVREKGENFLRFSVEL